jgi:hypothetical protein
MRTYDVYHHPTKGYEAIKRGFSWQGFFFGLFWALVKKLWKAAGILLLALLISEKFFQLLSEPTAFFSIECD